MAINDIARVYATSLVEIAKEKNLLEQIEEEIKVISDLISEDADLHQFLESPSISKEEKKSFLSKTIAGFISEDSLHFLYILIDNDRQSYIHDVYSAIIENIDEVKNRLRVTIITSESMQDNIQERIKSELETKFKKEIILHHEVKNEIIGGIIIKIGDIVIDGSLLKDLKNIKKNLIMGKIRSEAAYED